MKPYAGRALLIDTDSTQRARCIEVLGAAGFAVGIYTTTTELIASLAGHAQNLDLLILKIPAGSDLLLTLETLHHYLLEVPILLIGGEIAVEQAAQAMRLGARGLLLPPFSCDDLCNTALGIVGERQATRSSDRVAALRPALKIGERLLGELDLPRLQDQIIATVRAELDADRASLMLIDEESDNQWLYIVACSGLPPHVQIGHRRPINTSLSGIVALRREPLHIGANGELTPPIEAMRGELFEDQIVSALSVPVMARDQVLGVLNAAKVQNSPPFSAADKELLLMLASQAAIAIENARLYTRMAQSEARYRALLQHANDAVLLLDASGQSILDANLACERLSGYRHTDLIALQPIQILPAINDLVARVARNGEASESRGSQEIETELRTCQDQPRPVAVSVSAVPHAGQQLLLVIARDISERLRITKQLVQAEKLAGLGRLSASLAHEINNPLQAIHNSVHLLRTRELGDEKRQIYLNMTQDEINRLISIVQRMLDFYRPTREGMRPIDLHDILDTVLNLTESQIQERGVQVVRESPPQLPHVLAISNHIKQVCFNLIFNALEAMPDGGTLLVRSYLADTSTTNSVALNQLAVATSAELDKLVEPVVVLEFCDTGPGIPPDELPKIFEPFYTTRTKGTGMGLAVCYSIIEQHHGQLAVHSVPGEGATFRITLPVAR